MAYNTPWSEDEERDTALGWPAFTAKYPLRTYQAWRVRRLEVQKRQTALTAETPKPKPVSMPTPDAAETLTDAQLYDAVLTYEQAIAKAFPHALDYRVSVQASEPIAVCFPADWHIGSGGTDLARLRRDCELIASHPRLYCALGGDVADNFILSKMIEASRSQVATPDVQWRLFRYLVGIILDSLLWVSSGNHDAWTLKAAGIDPILAALKDIPSVPIYTREGGFIDVTVGTQTYTIWRKHKPRNNSNINRTYGGKTMLRMWAPREFDIGINEHYHEAGYEWLEYRRRPRIIMNTGSYKITDSYAEAGGFYGGGYGVPTVILYPDRHKMLPFASIEDALEVLDGPSLLAASA